MQITDIEDPKALFDQMSVHQLLQYGRANKKTFSQMVKYAPGFARHKDLIEACSNETARIIMKQVYTGRMRSHITFTENSLMVNDGRCLVELREFCRSHNHGDLKMNRLFPINIAISRPWHLERLALIQNECLLNLKIFGDNEFSIMNVYPIDYINPEVLEAMTAFLGNDNRLVSLDMSNTMVTRADIIPILEGLRRSKYLRKAVLDNLQIISAPLDPIDPTNMENFVPQEPLPRIAIDQSLAALIADLIKGSTLNQLKHLSLSDLRTSENALDPVFDALKSKANTLTFLNLSGTNAVDLEPLFEALADTNCRLSVLDMSRMDLNDEQAFQLVETLELPKSVKLKTLMLSQNDFTDEGTRRIAELLTFPTNKLILLDIADNVFDLETLNLLKDILGHHNCHLKRLWISLEHLIDEPGALRLLRFMFPHNSVDFLPAGHGAILKSAIMDPSALKAMIDANFLARNVSINDEFAFSHDDRNVYAALIGIAEFKRNSSALPGFTLTIDH